MVGKGNHTYSGGLCMPKAKKGRTVKIAAVIVIVVIVCTGVYLGLAWPAPIYSQPFNFSGAATQSYSVSIGFPKSQVQVVVELTAATAAWSFQIKNSTGDLIATMGGLAINPGTYASAWVDAAGSCTVVINCVGSLTGTVTVFGRGIPFVTA
jgi:hypothetical protein